jgi:hypothetical protein
MSNILVTHVGVNNCTAPMGAAVATKGGTSHFTVGSSALKGSEDDTSQTAGINCSYYLDCDGKPLGLGDIVENIAKGTPNGGIDAISHRSAICGASHLMTSPLPVKIRTVMKKIGENMKASDPESPENKKRLGNLTPLLEVEFSAHNDTKHSIIAKLFQSDGTGTQCTCKSSVVSQLFQMKPTRS